MAQAFLLGRILVGCYYLEAAYHHFTAVGQMSRYVAAHGVPAPEAAVIVAGLLLLVAGVTFLFGVFPRVGVAAIVLFLLPVTLIMHAFWADRDPAQRQADMINFTKNIALLGSSLMFLAVPRPWPYSVERRWRVPVRAPV
jgi:putative oxidoreductase